MFLILKIKKIKMVCKAKVTIATQMIARLYIKEHPRQLRRKSIKELR